MSSHVTQAHIGDDKWERLSPIAICYFIARALKQLMNNVYYLIPAFAISVSSFKQQPTLWILVSAGLLLLIVLSAFLQYLFYTYRIFDHTVEIKQGVFSKAHIHLPFERIQNVAIDQPIYFRPFHLFSVSLDTAGSAQQEANIAAIDFEKASYLRTVVTESRVDTSSTTVTQPSEQPGELQGKLLNSRTVRDLMLHGLTNNRIWIILGVTVPIWDDVGAFLSQYLDAMGINFDMFYNTNTSIAFVLSAVSFVIIALALLLALSMIGSVIVYYRFTLHKVSDRYIRKCGLFTKQEITLKQSRLQMIVMKQAWLDCLLKRINVELKQNVTGFVRQQNASSKSTIVIPSVTISESIALCKDAFADNQMRTIEYTGISKLFIPKQLLTWIVPASAGLAALSIKPLEFWAIFVFIIGFVLGTLLVWWRWRRWGIAKDSQYIYIRRGIFGVDYCCIPIHKVQQVQYKQSILMRRKRLATVVLITATGSVKVPLLAESYASATLNEVVTSVSCLRRSWM